MRLTWGTRLGGLAASIVLAGLGLATTASEATAQPAAASASSASVTPFAGVFNPIRNVGNGKCLQPAGGSTAEFAPIVQMPCTNSIAQGWQYLKVATNHYRFVNQLSGYCFDAFDGAFNGARLLQGTCVPISNEEYNTAATLPNVVSVMARVGFRDTGYCVDVPGAQATDGLAMQIYRCNGTLAQRWVVGFG